MDRQTDNIQLRLRHVDPYALFGSLVSLVLVLVNDPWWSVHGTTDNNLFSIQVSPYYLKTLATGIAQTVPLAGPLGFATRIVLITGFVALFSASVRPNAWWHDYASYFGMSSLAELFLSFLLMLHAAEATLLGAYGSLPPFSGTGQLSGSIIGLDLAYHLQPLVTAGFSLPIYLGLASCSLIGFSVLARSRHDSRKARGVAAIFTSGPEDHQEE